MPNTMVRGGGIREIKGYKGVMKLRREREKTDKRDPPPPYVPHCGCKIDFSGRARVK